MTFTRKPSAINILSEQCDWLHIFCWNWPDVYGGSYNTNRSHFDLDSRMPDEAYWRQGSLPASYKNYPGSTPCPCPPESHRQTTTIGVSFESFHETGVRTRIWFGRYTRSGWPHLAQGSKQRRGKMWFVVKRCCPIHRAAQMVWPRPWKMDRVSRKISCWTQRQSSTDRAASHCGKGNNHPCLCCKRHGTLPRPCPARCPFARQVVCSSWPTSVYSLGSCLKA